jgi:hypothetical protein
VSEDLRERLLDILADVCMNVHVHDYEALPGGIDLGKHADAILALLSAPEPAEDHKAGKRLDGFAALYALVYPIVVEVGRGHGYVMGLHGSLARDLDVIAAPWVGQPSEPADVVEEICHRLGAIAGEDLCTVPPERGPAKPHREVWNVVLRGGAFLDISFALRSSAPELAETGDEDGMSYKERADLYRWLHQEQSRRMHALHEYVQNECSNEPEWVPGGYWLDTALALLKRLRVPVPTAAEPESEAPTPEKLRAMAEWFDDPANPGVDVVVGFMTPGHLLRRIADAQERLATPEAEGGSP